MAGVVCNHCGNKYATDVVYCMGCGRVIDQVKKESWFEKHDPFILGDELPKNAKTINDLMDFYYSPLKAIFASRLQDTPKDMSYIPEEKAIDALEMDFKEMNFKEKAMDDVCGQCGSKFKDGINCYICQPEMFGASISVGLLDSIVDPEGGY